MWIDSQGVCHTVALPDPTLVMSAVFRNSLDRLLAMATEDVAELVEAEEMRFHQDRAEAVPGSTNEAEFEGVAAPEVLTEPVATMDDLRSLIRSLDDRWRLDALVAVDDYLSTHGVTG